MDLPSSDEPGSRPAGTVHPFTLGHRRVDPAPPPAVQLVQVDLHLLLAPGPRLSGTVGRLGNSDYRPFQGWVLMCAIDHLRTPVAERMIEISLAEAHRQQISRWF